MLTYEGVNIQQHLTNVPTLNDIEISLKRMCRYNGFSRIFWSVLDHSMCVRRYLDVSTSSDTVCLLGLLHDAAECIIGDIPRGFKSEDMELIESNFQTLIFREYISEEAAMHFVSKSEEWKKVKEADDMILWAELQLVGPYKTSLLEPGTIPNADRLSLEIVQEQYEKTLLAQSSKTTLQYMSLDKDKLFTPFRQAYTQHKVLMGGYTKK